MSVTTNRNVEWSEASSVHTGPGNTIRGNKMEFVKGLLVAQAARKARKARLRHNSERKLMVFLRN